MAIKKTISKITASAVEAYHKAMTPRTTPPGYETTRVGSQLIRTKIKAK